MSKAIMYHYVRHSNPDLPFFRYLSVDNFNQQLDWLIDQYDFPSKDDFLASLSTGRAWKGVVLTFDDGFSDHYDFVLPALKERGIWGIFFIPTSPYNKHKLLEAHRIHMILGKLGGADAMELLSTRIDRSMLSHVHVDDFRLKTYRSQDNDHATEELKRILNYYISYEYREKLLDELMQEAFEIDESELSRQFYMTPNQIRELDAEGMIIGSHGANHLVFSKLSASQQQSEITNSTDFIEQVTGKETRFFCYPYGGFHSFNDTTERLLTENGISATFNVESRDVSNTDIITRPQALPRYDCNQFPHGEASLG